MTVKRRHCRRFLIILLPLVQFLIFFAFLFQNFLFHLQPFFAKMFSGQCLFRRLHAVTVLGWAKQLFDSLLIGDFFGSSVDQNLGLLRRSFHFFIITCELSDDISRMPGLQNCFRFNFLAMLSKRQGGSYAPPYECLE